MLAEYDASKLDGPSLLQLVRACEAAGDLKRAAAAAQAAFSKLSNADDATRWQIVRLTAPLVRDQLGDPHAALKLLEAAANCLHNPEWRAACQLAAADSLLNDLLLHGEARKLLEAATPGLKTASPELTSRLHRVWGDYYARTGKSKEARREYLQAEALSSKHRPQLERTAWQGAYSRSVEAFLREKQLDRARDELRRWLQEFPADMIDGYLPLLYARYLAAGNKHQQAAAKANDALNVSHDSPYADQLLELIAQCEERLGALDKAIAAWQSLVTDYPGSPLVEKAKQELDRLKERSAATRASRKQRPAAK